MPSSMGGGGGGDLIGDLSGMGGRRDDGGRGG